jgi:hypothetical protein
MMNYSFRCFKPITYLIYDLDELLLGTETLCQKVNQIIAQHYGKTFYLSVKAKMAGRRTKESAQLFVELLDIPLTPEEYIKERYAPSSIHFMPLSNLFRVQRNYLSILLDKAFPRLFPQVLFSIILT